MTAARLRIALPWLGEALAGMPDEVPRLPAAEWLVARARRGRTGQGWREWLLEDASTGPGLLERFPAGPCVRAAWTDEHPVGTWACAAPVHLVAALDHLRLAAPVPVPLEPEESSALVADLNRLLAPRGFLLEESGRGWLCRCPQDLDCRAVEPMLAVGGNLRDLQPSGRDAARVRAWINEAQMVLHEHPVNLRRAAHDLPTVNSVWLWGFGTTGTVQHRPEGDLLSDDDWLAGLWRLHGAQAGRPERLGAALDGDAPVIRVGVANMDGPDGRPAWTSLEQHVFAPVRDALLRGRLQSASFLLGALTLEIPGAARLQFWRRSRPLAEALR